MALGSTSSESSSPSCASAWFSVVSEVCCSATGACGASGNSGAVGATTSSACSACACSSAGSSCACSSATGSSSSSPASLANKASKLSVGTSWLAGVWSPSMLSKAGISPSVSSCCASSAGSGAASSMGSFSMPADSKDISVAAKAISVSEIKPSSCLTGLAPSGTNSSKDSSFSSDTNSSCSTGVSCDWETSSKEGKSCIFAWYCISSATVWGCWAGSSCGCSSVGSACSWAGCSSGCSAATISPISSTGFSSVGSACSWAGCSSGCSSAGSAPISKTGLSSAFSSVSWTGVTCSSTGCASSCKSNTVLPCSSSAGISSATSWVSITGSSSAGCSCFSSPANIPAATEATPAAAIATEESFSSLGSSCCSSAGFSSTWTSWTSTSSSCLSSEITLGLMTISSMPSSSSASSFFSSMIWSITSSLSGEVISLMKASRWASSSVGVVSAGIFSSTTFSASLESFSACTGVSKSWNVFSASSANWALYIESIAELRIKSSLAGSNTSSWDWVCSLAEATISSAWATSSPVLSNLSFPANVSAPPPPNSTWALEMVSTFVLPMVASGTWSIFCSKRDCISFKRVRNSANSSISASNLENNSSFVLASKPPPKGELGSRSNSKTEDAFIHCWFPLEADSSEQISVSGVKPLSVTNSDSLCGPSTLSFM